MGEYDFAYVHTDIPEGMTIREWRAARRPLRPHRRAGLACAARIVGASLGRHLGAARMMRSGVLGPVIRTRG